MAENKKEYNIVASHDEEEQKLVLAGLTRNQTKYTVEALNENNWKIELIQMSITKEVTF